MVRIIVCLILIPAFLFAQGTTGQTIMSAGLRVRLKAPQFYSTAIGVPWLEGDVSEISGDTLYVESAVDSVLLIPSREVASFEVRTAAWEGGALESFGLVVVSPKESLAKIGLLANSDRPKYSGVKRIVVSVIIILVMTIPGFMTERWANILNDL